MNTHAAKTSEQMEVDPSDTIKTHNTRNTSSETRKRTASQVDPCATHLDVNSLPSPKKQKYLKASIKNPKQSYSYLTIDQ